MSLLAFNRTELHAKRRDFIDPGVATFLVASGDGGASGRENAGVRCVPRWRDLAGGVDGPDGCGGGGHVWQFQSGDVADANGFAHGRDVASGAGVVLAGCACKHLLGRLPLGVQGCVGVALGALAGVWAGALWGWLGLSAHVPWVACAASGALVASVLVAGLIWRTRAQVPAGAQARLTELQSRIRPHFLFNTLNSAIALVRAEPARAEALLEDLSELFRSALADPTQEVTLAQELQLAERYLAIEQIRFGNRLRLTWSLDPAAHAARLPPLILQPLVENAVRHGVEPSAKGADIHVSTQRRGDRVVIKISNSVPAGTGQGARAWRCPMCRSG